MSATQLAKSFLAGTLGSETAYRVTKPTVNDVLIINGLDLRPLGLEIYSDAKGLHIMGSTMTTNMISGVPVVMVVP